MHNRAERAHNHAPPGHRLRVLAVVPCYNEAQTVASVVRGLRDIHPDFHPLVVDDGSTDRTHQAARRLCPTVPLPVNLGIGGAVQTGLRYAHRHGYDLCIQVDGDGQHPPQEALKLYQAYLEHPADLLIGSRYLESDRLVSSQARRAGGRLIAGLINTLFRLPRPVTDPTSGLRMMNRRALAWFQNHYPVDYPEPITLAQAARLGFSVREVPVTMRHRQGGTSSITTLQGASYMVRVMSYILLNRLRPAAE